MYQPHNMRNIKMRRALVILSFVIALSLASPLKKTRSNDKKEENVSKIPELTPIAVQKPKAVNQKSEPKTTTTTTTIPPARADDEPVSSYDESDGRSNLGESWFVYMNEDNDYDGVYEDEEVPATLKVVTTTTTTTAKTPRWKKFTTTTTTKPPKTKKTSVKKNTKVVETTTKISYIPYKAAIQEEVEDDIYDDDYDNEEYEYSESKIYYG